MESLSQYGEDLLVVERFSGRRQGFFVEVGAADGIAFSNTLLLERSFAWTGILIEADPRQAELCRANRPGSMTIGKAVTSPARVANPLMLQVVEGFEALSGVSLSRETKRTVKLGHEGRELAVEPVQVETTTLDAALSEAHAPRDIDFMSIDIEGHEVAALEGFSLGRRWRPKVLLIENNHLLPNRAVNRRLLAAGYGHVRTVAGINEWFEPMSRSAARQRRLMQYVMCTPVALKAVLRLLLRRLGLLEAARRILARHAR